MALVSVIEVYNYCVIIIILPLRLLLLFGIVSIKEDGTVGAVCGFVCGGGGERCFLLLLLCPRWSI